jgi:hypothetical protein
VDEQQQQRVNRAAEEYANAVVEAQRAMAERGVSAQEMNAQLNQQFFNGVIDNLQRMAAETRGASQELAEQTQRAQQAAQTLTQETAGAYMEYMNSLFAMSQEGVQAAERGAEETRRVT